MVKHEYQKKLFSYFYGAKSVKPAENKFFSDSQV